MKRLINFRLSDQTLAVLDTYAKIHGLTRTGMLEMIVNLYASRAIDEAYWSFNTPPSTPKGAPDGRHRR
jgi:hypothetical protein